MEINLEDFIHLNVELTEVERQIAKLMESGASVELALQQRDVVIKKLLVFYYLFHAGSDRLEEILGEEPEYQAFLRYIEEADTKDAVEGESPQRREPEAADRGDGVRSWYGGLSPLSHVADFSEAKDAVSDQ